MSNLDMITQAHFDWMTFTKHYDPGVDVPTSRADATAVAYKALADSNLDNYLLTFIKGLPFYTWAFLDRNSGVKIYVSPLLKQGIMIVVDGDSCSRLDTGSVLFCERLNAAGWKCTRCDVAIDLFYWGITAENFADAYELTHTGETRTISIIKSVNGSTFYVGSRKSAFYLRVYDKGLQQRTDMPWTRIEIEIKGLPANTIMQKAGSAIQQGVSAISAILGEAVPSRLALKLAELSAGEICPQSTQPTMKGNTELWLESQVLPAFRKIAENNPEFARDYVCQLLEIVAVGQYNLEQTG